MLLGRNSKQSETEANSSMLHCGIHKVGLTKYLGRVISNDGSLDREIASRISKASQALQHLRNRLLSNHNVTLDTKLRVYRAVVRSSLLYGCETCLRWTGHVIRMEDHRIPKQVLFGELEQGSQETGPSPQTLQGHSQSRPEMV